MLRLSWAVTQCHMTREMRQRGGSKLINMSDAWDLMPVGERRAYKNNTGQERQPLAEFRGELLKNCGVNLYLYIPLVIHYTRFNNICLPLSDRKENYKMDLMDQVGMFFFSLGNITIASLLIALVYMTRRHVPKVTKTKFSLWEKSNPDGRHLRYDSTCTCSDQQMDRQKRMERYFQIYFDGFTSIV
jgi:hypothetical protein